MFAKVKHENYIFIENASFVRKKQAMATRKAQKMRGKKSEASSNRLEDAIGVNTDHTEMLQPHEMQQGEAETRKIEKAERAIYKKFYHLNTKRMLDILGYSPSASDERKFLASNNKQ